MLPSLHHVRIAGGHPSGAELRDTSNEYKIFCVVVFVMNGMGSKGVALFYRMSSSM